MICARSHPRQFYMNDILYRESASRKVSWDELFLDLLYVSIVSRLAGVVKINGIDWLSLNDFYLVFVPVYLSWNTIVLYINRYSRNDTFDRLLLYFSMALAFGMGLNAEYAFVENSTQNTGNVFIATYLIMRAIYLFIYILYGYWAPEFAKANFFFSVLPPIVASIPFFVSIFFPVTSEGLLARRILWWMAYLFDIALFLGALKAAEVYRQYFKFRVALNIEHWVERMGLWIIIVLGEIIVSILWSSTSPSFSFLYVDTILSLVVAVSIEWLYFYLIDGYSGKFTHPIRARSLLGLFWSLLHTPFSAAIVAAGVGIGILVKYDPAGYGYSPNMGGADGGDIQKKFGYDNVRWLVCGCYAFAMFILVVLGMLYKSHEDVPTRHSRGGTSPGATAIEMSQIGAASSSQLSPQSQGSTSLPEFLKRDRATIHIPEGHAFRPRFPKWLRLTIRSGVGVIFIIVGAAGHNLSVTGLLGIMAVVAFFGVFLEEIGRLRVVKRV